VGPSVRQVARNATTIRDRSPVLDAIIGCPVRAELWRGLAAVDRITERTFCAVFLTGQPVERLELE
jgi:hypothetical protein